MLEETEKNTSYDICAAQQFWNVTNSPNRLTHFFMRKTNILDRDPCKKPINYVLIGFLIPFLGMCFIYLLMGFIYALQDSYFLPGSNKVFSLLNSDAYHQYYPFFKAFRASILSGKSLIYCWDIGMGIDYLGLYAYYLGSPLNWLSILIPEAWLLNFFTFLTPIRLGFAGMFFAYFLNKIFDRNDISIALFGSFYATCAWVFGYMWNTMWLDTFALLPLVVTGTLRLLKDRDFILYTVSLFFSVFINYYIGFFTCIFTLLVFICYEICRWKGFLRFFADLSLMAVFTILAIGATAVITIPAYASLLTTNAGDSMTFAQQLNLGAAGGTTAPDITAPSTTFGLHLTDKNELTGLNSWEAWLGLLEGMVKVSTNTFAYCEPNVVRTEGLPNVYCGVFANIFAFLFITCKQVKWRDRICAVLLLLFINASFVINNLNYMWHGFHEPNMIPYRFSFLYSFVMLYMAYRAFLLRRRIKPWQIVTAAIILLVCLVLSQSFAGHMKLLEQPFSLYCLMNPQLLFPYVNLLLLIGYFAALLILTIRKRLSPDADPSARRIWYQKLHFRRSLGSFMLILIICAELVLNFAFFSVSSSLAVDAANYPKGGSDTAKVIAYMKEQENDLFYRAETTHQQIYNDSSLNDYSGITTFTSSANVNVTNFLRAMGYAAYPTYNRYCYEDASPLSNLFLNVKYMIERDGIIKDNPYFTDVYQSGNVHLLENNQYLPLGFMVNPELSEISVKNVGNRFTFQNNFLSAALGKNAAPWNHISGEQVEITGNENIQLSGISKYTVASTNYTVAEKSGEASYIYNIDNEGFFCAFFSISYSSSVSAPRIKFYVDKGNGFTDEPLYTDTYALAYLLSVGQVKSGDRVKIVIECSPNSSGTIQVTGALLNETIMQEAYSQLSQSPIILTKFEDTLVEGTINCKQSGLLYTSIPQTSDNWHVFVDGIESEIVLIGDVMIGVMLEEGSHTITFRYENKAFSTGLTISIICILLFSILCGSILLYRKRIKKQQ